MTTTIPKYSPYCYLIARNQKVDHYRLYNVDPESEELFKPVPLSRDASFDRSYRMAQAGGFLLQWGPLTTQNQVSGYQFKLLNFDPAQPDPLNGPVSKSGFWAKTKFWGSYRDHYSSNPDEGQHLDLTPMTGFVLNIIPAAGRGTFKLWNFDPEAKASDGNPDPLPRPYSDQGAFPLIKEGHNLMPIGNYVLDRLPDRKRFRLWSFDPQLQTPLALPTVQEGEWHDIDETHELVVIGSHVLDWQPDQGRYRLWEFHPEHPEVLVGPVREGKLPEEIGTDALLTGFQPRTQVREQWAGTPGTIDFMRTNIKHVVYYMLESRSFDNVCGWLYEKGDQGCHYIGSDQRFDGASRDDFNFEGKKKVHVSQYQDGKLSDKWDLKALDQDPFHGTADNLQQMFSKPPGYWGRAKPDMGGFVLNNANPQVMETFSSEQLPVLNGLARKFAVSDEWFSSIPGGTDVNRAFSVTGSAFNRLDTWEGGSEYRNWPEYPHRQSIWKALWSNGISDWKIYNSVTWEECVFTYQLYLQGQIPTVDEASKEYLSYIAKHPHEARNGNLPAFGAKFLANLAQFKLDAQNGGLPAFSYLEPAWIAPHGATSYHPGGDLVPGERELNAIYEAIKNGPGWDKTLLFITFDKGGGVYDHVAPPYANKPWPNDLNNGFAYDLLGSRVPAIMVSPWIKEQTVIRAGGEKPFDSTSFVATLLDWFGVPRPLWGLGDRMETAPTFEKVFQASEPRADAPGFTPPFDKSFPSGNGNT